MFRNATVILILAFALSNSAQADDLHNFADYKVAITTTKVFDYVDISSHPNAAPIQDAFEWHYELNQSVNFAGQYYLLVTGCGTMCQAVAVVDIDSGQMIDLISASAGVCFQADSNLMITNPYLKDAFGEDIPEWASTYYYKFTSTGFELLDETKTSYSGECVSGQ